MLLSQYLFLFITLLINRSSRIVCSFIPLIFNRYSLSLPWGTPYCLPQTSFFIQLPFTPLPPLPRPYLLYTFLVLQWLLHFPVSMEPILPTLSYILIFLLAASYLIPLVTNLTYPLFSVCVGGEGGSAACLWADHTKVINKYFISHIVPSDLSSSTCLEWLAGMQGGSCSQYVSLTFNLWKALDF